MPQRTDYYPMPRWAGVLERTTWLALFVMILGAVPWALGAVSAGPVEEAATTAPVAFQLSDVSR